MKQPTLPNRKAADRMEKYAGAFMVLAITFMVLSVISAPPGLPKIVAAIFFGVIAIVLERLAYVLTPEPERLRPFYYSLGNDRVCEFETEEEMLASLKRPLPRPDAWDNLVDQPDEEKDNPPPEGWMEMFPVKPVPARDRVEVRERGL